MAILLEQNVNKTFFLKFRKSGFCLLKSVPGPGIIDCRKTAVEQEDPAVKQHKAVIDCHVIGGCTLFFTDYEELYQICYI